MEQYKHIWYACLRLNKHAFSYTSAAIATIIGILPILFLTNLPAVSSEIIILLMIMVILLFIKINRTGKFVCCILFMFFWGLWHSIDITEKIYLLSEREHELTFTVMTVPVNNLQQKIKVRIDTLGNSTVFPPLYAYWKVANGHDICAGQQWGMKTKLKPIHSLMNEGGFNQQRYQLSQRLIGAISQKQANPITLSCSLRHHIIDHYRDKISLLTQAGIIYALMFGERGLLQPEQAHLLQATGLTHLIAISGLHIGLAYYLGCLLARGIQLILPRRFITVGFPVLIGLMFAISYAWISNFAIPATRALYALLLWVYIRQQPFFCQSWQWALWSVAIILIVDPLSILADSFWLSCFAVLAILYWHLVFPIPLHVQQKRVIGKLLSLAHLQIGLLILLMPMQVLLFNGINIMSFFANLWFVPIVSWIVVPAIFSLFLLPIDFIHHSILSFVNQVIDFGLQPINALSGYWITLNNPPMYLLIFCWPILIVILFGWSREYLGLLGSILVLLLIERLNEPDKMADWKLTVLDIGHGLAISIEQNNLAYLYDTGNRWTGGSNASRQIIPYLNHHGITPIGLILSHNHLDHTGGVADLLQKFPWLNIRSSFSLNNNQIDKGELRKRTHLPCIQGTQWQWGILKFNVLWPEKLSDVSHNDDSCVIQISDGINKILLTGDIEKRAENAIASLYKQALNSDILLAPHHGSSTSSSPLLIRMVKPSIVLVSSARYSAWKIPSEKVRFRYKNNIITWLNTAEEGQITIWFKKEKINVTGYRYQIQPRWYHLWFGLPLFPE